MIKNTHGRNTLLALLVALTGCASEKTAGGDDDTTDAGGNQPPVPEDDGGKPEPSPSDMSMGGFSVDLSDPDATYDGALRVMQADGTPVAATLKLAGKSYASNAAGHIKVTDLPAAKTLTGVIASQGYLTRGVKLSFAAIGQAEKRIVLEKVAVLATLEASAGGAIDAVSTKVTFPANAFLDAEGNVFDGKVIVAAAAQDPASLVLSDYESGDSFEVRSDFDFDRVPDGYLFAEQADGSVSFQYPEAVFSVDIADEDGNALRINPAATASFSIRLPSITQRLAGDVVEVFTFDEQRLQWTPDGTCTVQAADGGLACVGEAKHFSARSMPVNASGSVHCFEYRVERRNFPEGASVRQWSQSQAGTSTLRAEINELNSHGLCHLSAQSKGRVNLEITSGAEVRLFESAWDQGIPSVKFGTADTTALNERHECPACVVRVVVADWNALGAATDKDGDGYYTGSSVTVPDCDDGDKSIHPGATETVCDTKDRNCDGTEPPGWTKKTRVQAAADGATAAVWNSTLCGLSCVVPDSLEERGTRPEWDDNCDRSLECPAGTELVEGTCQLYKSCTQVTCSSDATCAVGNQGAVCTCNSGFSGNGTTCVDVDECLTNNGGCGAPTAYTCENNTGAAPTCADIDECDTDNGGCEVDCANSTGSFTCACGEGETLNEDGKTCDSVDACTGNPCDAEGDTSSTCSVEGVSYSCTCSAGYEVTGTGTQVCSEIDACDGAALEACGGADNCVDEAAPSTSFHCDCGLGYIPGQGEQTCLDFDACDLSSNPCQDGGDFNAQCSDDSAPSTDYTCLCGEGYFDDGNTCSMPMTCGACGDPGCCATPECATDPMCMTSSCFSDCSAPGCCNASECLGSPVCGGGGGSGPCFADGICDQFCPGGDPDCAGGGGTGGGCIPGMFGCP